MFLFYMCVLISFFMFKKRNVSIFLQENKTDFKYLITGILDQGQMKNMLGVCKISEHARKYKKN